jgi:hypothetical protein
MVESREARLAETWVDMAQTFCWRSDILKLQLNPRL